VKGDPLFPGNLGTVTTTILPFFPFRSFGEMT
jgi:hypothetical protein